ncbi:MAG: DUF59 domain-containing protein, partial [Xanthomonadales bacterium]|nr:DUF59 domain-containing protein [Xanthomonadales bacterium]
MESLSKEQVEGLLAGIEDPNTGCDLVTGGAVKGVGLDGDRVAVDLR